LTSLYTQAKISLQPAPRQAYARFTSINMSLPLISIIIPIYNSELWLGECIQSIQNQSYKNWELICINDGSRDQSACILEQLAQSEPRMHIIEQANAGVSSARNKGIAAAHGEYIIFVDSDDIIHPQCLEIIQAAQQKNPHAFIMYQLQRGTKQKYQVELEKNFLQEKGHLTNDAHSFYIASIKPYACTKLFQRNIIIAHQLRFSEGMPINEDLHFVMNYSYYFSIYCQIDAPLYLYRINPDSACGEGIRLDRPIEHYTNYVYRYIPLMRRVRTRSIKEHLTWQMGLYMKVSGEVNGLLGIFKTACNPRPEVYHALKKALKAWKWRSPFIIRLILHTNIKNQKLAKILKINI